VKSGLPGALEQTRSRWAASSSIQTDDAVVRELFDKARFGLPGMIADNGVMNAGIFEYGGQWVRDTSNTFTCKSTCCTPPTLIALITLG